MYEKQTDKQSAKRGERERENGRDRGRDRDRKDGMEEEREGGRGGRYPYQNNFVLRWEAIVVCVHIVIIYCFFYLSHFQLHVLLNC